MTNTADQRRYQRCSSTVCKTTVSVDGRNYETVELSDLSAGGLRFASNNSYKQDTRLLFTLSIYNMLSEFVLRLEGHVVRVENEKDNRIHAVTFDHINKYDQVQLDEIVRSRVTVKSSSETRPMFEDGHYAFLFIPRIRTGRLRMYK